MKHPLCNVHDIPEAGSLLVDFFGREVHIYKANGRPRAVANVCMHFGGPLQCENGKFVCDWHNAEFDMTGGNRIGGPAPTQSRLMFLSTVVKDGVLNYVWAE